MNMLTYLLILGVVSKQLYKTAPWPSRELHHFGKLIEPSDERAGRGCYCFLMRWHSWHSWAFELKFEFFSFNTFDVSQIFWQRIVQTRLQYSYCIFLKGLCWVSVCWILAWIYCLSFKVSTVHIDCC